MDLIDGLETKDLCASWRRRHYSLETTRCYALVLVQLGGVCMCMKKVFSLQFHAGKRRDDILKDPGTNQRCFVMMDFLRHQSLFLK